MNTRSDKPDADSPDVESEGLSSEKQIRQRIDDEVIHRTAQLTSERDESRRVERELARLAAIVESSEDAIIGKTLEGVVTSWNIGAERIYGYTAGEMIGQSITRIIPPDRMHEFHEIFDRLKKGQRIQQYETERLRKNNKRIYVSLTISPIYDGQGRIVGASAIGRNTTAHRRTQQEIQRAHAILQRKTQETEEFLSIMAHDMMHPVVGIQGLLTLIRQDCLQLMDPDSQTNLNMALEECDRMKQMIRRLAELGRIGRSRPQREPANLADLVATCVNRFRKPLDDAGILVRQHAPDSMAMLACQYVEEALSNLLDNAIKYGCNPKEPRIEIECRHEDDWVHLSVWDNGPGIDPKHHKRIFQPFRRIKTPNGPDGSGIGLAAVKRLIQELGGDIELDSTAANGTRFTLSIPDEPNE
ncbi:PAS domain S-box protein [Planctomycetales bacterium ZRK34]|nr:PAS domain S-box protein [Planctomycetales bacterium ZRK34]